MTTLEVVLSCALAVAIIVIGFQWWRVERLTWTVLYLSTPRAPPPPPLRKARTA